MTHGFQLDPYSILGVARGASSQEVRDAYREKTKKHHPDRGGDEWAFRVVVRAYEILNHAPTQVHAAPPPTPRPGASAGPARDRTGPRPAAASPNDRVRAGVQDKEVDPDKLVDVEILWFRFEVENLFELVGGAEGDHNLSGAMNIAWPSATRPDRPADPAADAETLRKLDEVFDEMRVKTRVVSSRSRNEGGRFVGWLSYPSGTRAWAAFQTLHEALNARGLGARQWTRDMMIPRG